jgi:hypothetical protein
LRANTTVTTTSPRMTWIGSSPGIHPNAKLKTVRGSFRMGKKALTVSSPPTMLTAKKTQGMPP